MLKPAARPTRPVPTRYRLYSPIHRSLTALAGLKVAGKHPAIVVRNRLNQIAFATVLRSSQDFVIEARENFLIKLPGGDQAAASIIFDREYSPSEARMLMSLFALCDSFIDVGANLGYFSLLALKRSAGRKAVLAVEPNPSLVRLIKESLELNGFQYGNVLWAAIGARGGECELVVNAHESSTSRVRTTSGASQVSNVYRVPVVTLDDVFSQRPFERPLIKIDVEGAEADVFRGASLALAARSIIVSEVSTSSTREICGLLEQYNYSTLTEYGSFYSPGMSVRTVIFTPSSHTNSVIDILRANPSVS